jgi:hypothetical protein
MHTLTQTAPPDVDMDAHVPCDGVWSGEDAEHTRCPNTAEWAGLSDHEHSKTSLRCTPHRAVVDLAVRRRLMYCLICHGPILVMNWQEL